MHRRPRLAMAARLSCGPMADKFGGTILARGGEQGGNGGFAEVSGKQLLNYTGFADMRAPQRLGWHAAARS